MNYKPQAAQILSMGGISQQSTAYTTPATASLRGSGAACTEVSQTSDTLSFPKALRTKAPWRLCRSAPPGGSPLRRAQGLGPGALPLLGARAPRLPEAAAATGGAPGGRQSTGAEGTAHGVPEGEAQQGAPQAAVVRGVRQLVALFGGLPHAFAARAGREG